MERAGFVVEILFPWVSSQLVSPKGTRIDLLLLRHLLGQKIKGTGFSTIPIVSTDAVASSSFWTVFW